MDLRVKQKIINGKKVTGIINENLKEITLFEFEKIVEFKQSDCKYFICEKEDGSCSLYDKHGFCWISYEDGYKELRILKSFCNFDSICVVAKKNDKVGILCLKLEYNPEFSNPIGVKVYDAYKFGKCDEIRDFDDTTVQLIKHTKGEDRIGYWYHKNINEIVEPKFLTYNYYTIKCKNGVGLYSYKDEHGNTTHDAYSLSDHVEYDKLTLNVEMIGYSKLKDKKKVVGLKQKVYDDTKSRYHTSFRFEDFIPANYSNISYDEETQIFFLEQRVNNKVKKGFMGVTFDWHFGGKGWWIWGYPNLRIEVNVPCEYDDIKMLGNYALVKKDEKYGLIKFSFGKSNGDWDYDNSKKKSLGRCREIVPCIYDSITKTQNLFIGQINQEERIITDCIDKKTDQTVIIANNYNKVKQIHDNVFLCELENSKKEVVVIKKHVPDYQWQDTSCSISKISSCDNAEIISNNKHGYLIKVTNDNIIDIYSGNGEKDVEIVERDIANCTYDLENNFYVIAKNNGHIIYIGSSGNVIFTTEKLGFEPSNLSVVYLKALNKFKVSNNGLIRIYSNLINNQAYENRLFSCFEELQTYYYTFVGYTEILEDGLITKLSRIDMRDNMKEIEILKGNFQVENVVLDGKRIIFSTIDYKDSKKKYGVIESQKGNICIDCAYDNIQFDSNNQVFICSSDEEQSVFDTDGFINENQNIENVGSNQRVLNLSL